MPSSPSSACALPSRIPPLDVEVFNAVKEKEDRSPGIFGQGTAMALAFVLSGMGFAAGNPGRAVLCRLHPPAGRLGRP